MHFFALFMMTSGRLMETWRGAVMERPASTCLAIFTQRERPGNTPEALAHHELPLVYKLKPKFTTSCKTVDKHGAYTCERRHMVVVAIAPAKLLNIDAVGHGATKEQVSPDGRTAEGARAASANLGRIAQAMFHRLFNPFLQDVFCDTLAVRRRGRSILQLISIDAMHPLLSGVFVARRMSITCRMNIRQCSAATIPPSA